MRTKGISVKFDKEITIDQEQICRVRIKRCSCKNCNRKRDLENGTLEIARRDTLEKNNVAQDEWLIFIAKFLRRNPGEFIYKSNRFQK